MRSENDFVLVAHEDLIARASYGERSLHGPNLSRSALCIFPRASADTADRRRSNLCVAVEDEERDRCCFRSPPVINSSQHGPDYTDLYRDERESAYERESAPQQVSVDKPIKNRHWRSAFRGSWAEPTAFGIHDRNPATELIHDHHLAFRCGKDKRLDQRQLGVEVVGEGHREKSRIAVHGCGILGLGDGFVSARVACISSLRDARRLRLRRMKVQSVALNPIEYPDATGLGP